MQIESLCKSCERIGQCFYEAPQITATLCSRYVKRKTRTNGDRIRAMTDEELAEWLTMVERRVIENTLSKPFKYTDDQLKEDWLDWLKQPMESEDDNG